MGTTLLTKIGNNKNSRYYYELTVRRTKLIIILKSCVYLFILITSLLIFEKTDMLNPINIGLILIPSTIWISISILKWLLEYYRLEPREIEHRQGIFFINKEIILLKNVETICLRQSLIGKLLNYGTIRLYAPTIQQDFQLKTIDKPEKFIRALEKSIHKENSDIKIIRKS